MNDSAKRVFVTIGIITIIYFVVFIFPNQVGVRDVNMIAIFEPDEFAQYPHPIRMLKQADTFKESFRRFVAYQHYYYGYPFYLLSALLLLPIKLLQGNLENTRLIMLTLRQLVSVLPMVTAISILVYMQTRFQSYLRSISLFVFLLAIPAVVRNNLWWHPDSLVTLFIVLTLFFLDKDRLDFGRYFFMAAAACGLAVGTKLIGLFFFLTIPTYIGWGLYHKRLDLKTALTRATQFLGIMFAAIIASNPMLLSASGRADILRIQQNQAEAMGFGWGIAYPSGPSSWINIIREYYGQMFFIATALIITIIGATRGPKKLLHTLILSWVFPFSLYILYQIAIKPKHFFIPIALPLYSALVIVIPESLKGLRGMVSKTGQEFKQRLLLIGQVIAIMIIAIQFTINIDWDVRNYIEKLYREENSASVVFFSEMEETVLSQLPDYVHLSIYRDVRVYVPVSSQWDVSIKWGLTDYEVIIDGQYDVVILWQQRILDYTQEGVLENAADPTKMKQTILFFSDASKGTLENYRLLYEDEFGKAFIKEELYEIYFAGE